MRLLLIVITIIVITLNAVYELRSITKCGYRPYFYVFNLLKLKKRLAVYKMRSMNCGSRRSFVRASRAATCWLSFFE